MSTATKTATSWRDFLWFLDDLAVHYPELSRWLEKHERSAELKREFFELLQGWHLEEIETAAGHVAQRMQHTAEGQAVAWNEFFRQLVARLKAVERSRRAITPSYAADVARFWIRRIRRGGQVPDQDRLGLLGVCAYLGRQNSRELVGLADDLRDLLDLPDSTMGDQR